MYEVKKLRQRLSNVGPRVTAYRMTVIEAKALLAEIDILLVPVAPIIMVAAPNTPPDILDCGGF